MGYYTKRVRLLCAVLACCLLACGPAVYPAAAEETAVSTDNSEPTAGSYAFYNEQYASVPAGQKVYPLDVLSPVDSSKTESTTYDGKACVSLSQDGRVDYHVDIPQDGRYQLWLTYYNLPGFSEIECSLSVDGELPFEEAGVFVLSRSYCDDTPYDNGFKKNTAGNDIVPSQVEKNRWQTGWMTDANGYVSEPFSLYLSAGSHTISIGCGSGEVAFSDIELRPSAALQTYEQVKAAYSQNGYVEAKGELVVHQAENAAYKSHQSIVPQMDRSSPATQPFEADRLLLNTIGGNKWNTYGQWIEWQVEVPETGLYRIALRARQNLVSGQASHRRLYIDGAVPFAEANNISFQFSSNFKTTVLGNEDGAYLFYLEKGVRTLRMENVLGDYTSVFGQLEKTVTNLNYAYREILKITGPEPDIFRDYDIQQQIPEVLDMLAEERENLQNYLDEIVAFSGGKGSGTEALTSLISSIDDMLEDVRKIPQRFNYFKEKTIGLSTWILDAKTQPLEIDYLVLLPEGQNPPRNELNFFVSAWEHIKMFISSFIVDYNNISAADSTDYQSISVWIATGRDMANNLRKITDNMFTPQYHIGVDIKLVPATALLPAILSGNAPDLYVNAGHQDPYNHAVRGVLEPLNGYEGFDEVIKRFNESAYEPFKLDGKVYALPETENFMMLYYRKDICEDMGIEIPETWDDVIDILPEFQKRHLQFGIPAMLSANQNDPTTRNIVDTTSYTMFLMQNGGSVYTEDLDAVALDSNVALDSFRQWTNYYINYRLPTEFDFTSRFRTGEMPMGITSYAGVAFMEYFAPEIKGLWDFTLVPGTRKADGTVDHSIESRVQGVEMFKDSQNKEAAWKFMTWWTGTEAQVAFGREYEATISAARYASANSEAYKQLNWKPEQIELIEKQRQFVRGIPEVPGSYLRDRELSFAFRQVINDGVDAREALLDHVDNINIEIAKKRKQFGMS